MHFLRRDSVLLRGASDNASSSAPDSPEFRMQSPTARDFRLQQWWLIDPKLLFVGRRIGEGAHAKVYEGKYCDQSVAVKIIRAGDTAEEAAKREARFNREVSMLSKVQHRNLVRFIGACKEPVMVVVTEHLQGGSLRKYLMELRPKCLNLHVAVGFALDIAQAMDCLHNNGIIHRDLKPENLLITSDHKTVKLVDLGLAREETLTEMMTAETGTYRWMAPELYSTVTLRHGEKKHYNHKVDVYSFSIVLWELLTNRMPFEGMSNLQAAYAAAFKGSRPSLSGDLDLPEDLILLMQSCWAEDPNARPNFAQIVRTLNALMTKLSAPEQIAPPYKCSHGASLQQRGTTHLALVALLGLSQMSNLKLVPLLPNVVSLEVSPLASASAFCQAQVNLSCDPSSYDYQLSFQFKFNSFFA